MNTPWLRIPVGVVVECRKANSPWADLLWRPVAVLPGLPEAAAWTPLTQDADTVTYYAGGAEIELFRSEADNYRCNLATGAPSIWIALQPTGGEPPYRIAAVTADPVEGEALSAPAHAFVEAVAMPDAVRQVVAAFLAKCPAGQTFTRRTRDRANPEAMARHAVSARRPHGPR